MYTGNMLFVNFHQIMSEIECLDVLLAVLDVRLCCDIVFEVTKA